MPSTRQHHPVRGVQRQMLPQMMCGQLLKLRLLQRAVMLDNRLKLLVPTLTVRRHAATVSLHPVPIVLKRMLQIFRRVRSRLKLLCRLPLLLVKTNQNQQHQRRPLRDLDLPGVLRENVMHRLSLVPGIKAHLVVRSGGGRQATEAFRMDHSGLSPSIQALEMPAPYKT